MRDQVRAALVDRDPNDPVSVKDLAEFLGIAPARTQDVYAYLRKLEREDHVERWEVKGQRAVLWGATARLRISFSVKLPPMRTRNMGPPDRRIRR